MFRSRALWIAFLICMLVGGSDLPWLPAGLAQKSPPKTPSFQPAHAKLQGPVWPNGEFFELTHDFVFTDSKGKKWKAPKGTLTDGASIPRIFLTLIGQPFDKHYLDAAVIHDAYCGEDNKPRESYHAARWQDVHLVFYEAMLASGCGKKRAKVIYAAVLFKGPSWPEKEKRLALDSIPDDALVREFKACQSWIEERDPTIEQIDNWMRSAEVRWRQTKPPNDK